MFNTFLTKILSINQRMFVGLASQTSFSGNIPCTSFNTVATADSTDFSTLVAAIFVVYKYTSAAVIISNRTDGDLSEREGGPAKRHELADWSGFQVQYSPCLKYIETVSCLSLLSASTESSDEGVALRHLVADEIF